MKTKKFMRKVRQQYSIQSSIVIQGNEPRKKCKSFYFEWDDASGYVSGNNTLTFLFNKM